MNLRLIETCVRLRQICSLNLRRSTAFGLVAFCERFLLEKMGSCFGLHKKCFFLNHCAIKIKTSAFAYLWICFMIICRLILRDDKTDLSNIVVSNIIIITITAPLIRHIIHSIVLELMLPNIIGIDSKRHNYTQNSTWAHASKHYRYRQQEAQFSKSTKLINSGVFIDSCVKIGFYW